MPAWPVSWEAAVPALPHPRHPLAHTAEHGAGGRAPAGVGAPPGWARPPGSPVSAPAAVHAPGDGTRCAAQHAPSKSLDRPPAHVSMPDPAKDGLGLGVSVVCVRLCGEYHRMSARAAWHCQALHALAAAGDDEGHAEDAFDDEDAEHASVGSSEPLAHRGQVCLIFH